MSNGKVLIADDEQDIRELLADFLESEGYECRLAANAYEAMKIFEKEADIDIIMSDIRMPGKSGLDLLTDVKKLNDDVLVIIISAVKDIESAITSMSRGAHDYIAKPFKLTEVSLVVHKAIEKRRLVQENRLYQQSLERIVGERTVELRRALDELNNTYYFTLRALVTALDTRDTETQGHSLRVVRYTLRLADLLDIHDKETLKIFEYGALLHDIGKIGIPDAILRKPGKLTPDEWVIMKTHPVIGYKVLRNIKFLEAASQIVLHHHEYFTGGGYPDGLSGETIPIGSRIFNVADTVDAMTSDRPYRKALTLDVTAAELQKCAGTQFDPTVVEAFLSIDLAQWRIEKDSIDDKFKEMADAYNF
jgi:putative two-component system response regulator